MQTTLAAEKKAHEHNSTLLQDASLACQGLNSHVSTLEERLEENERHRQSLDEKYLRARESLKYYRASTNDQRDQDIQRHEQQVQGRQAEMRQLQQSLIVKQDEVTRLNQEGVSLVSE